MSKLVHRAVQDQSDGPVLNWTRRSGNYGVGHICRAGDVRVGSVEYGASVTRGEERKWRVAVSLPDIKLAEPTLYATEEAAKARVEKSVRAWFRWAFADTPADKGAA